MVVSKESVLERVLREVPKSAHPSPFPRDKIPFFEGPWFDIGRRAVEILQDQREIIEFMKKYVEHIQRIYGLDSKESQRSAYATVGYCTGYIDDDQANRWFNALPDITHPVMGRERPFRMGDGVASYYIIGESVDEEIRNYLSRKLTKELSGLGMKFLGKSPIKGRDNARYFAFQLEPSKFTLRGPECYLYLVGFIDGLQSRMQEETGKSCKLSLETIRK